MAGTRARSSSVRRARDLSIGDDGRSLPLKRWDGASKTCRDWDGLRRDPDIWERNGNCLVHLYAKGDSKRGPSFKLPFAALLFAGCLPLIEKFLVLEGLASKTAQEIERWDQLHPRSTAELYIPAPPHATDKQAQHYHLAFRNLFAWVLGRPIVGENLGGALVTLLHSMHEFRSSPGSNVDDLLKYMRHTQYLDMAEVPVHATAALYLAETFELNALYKRAFAHCVGMHDRLFCTAEYQLISAKSRSLVRRARLEMSSMLQQTSNSLRGFLEEELSETNLGIPAGTRAHLERFRSFLLSFYSAKLGYYPPKAFSADLLDTMAQDFDALYELLVDNNYTVLDTIPSAAVGGICTEQLVKIFDENNGFEPLKHPLPQLPQLEAPCDGLRRLSKLPFVDKVVPGQRLVTIAALITASNWTEKCFKNDLVQAYRRFEEDAILSPSKADKSEKISLLEARKVRWIMIYAIHQVLRSATRKPAEVRGEEASYHLAVSMNGTPPWSSASHETRKPLRIQTDIVASDDDLVTKRAIKIQETPVDKREIKPDIDYFALTHKSRNPSLSTLSDNSSPATLSRSSSFSISLRRNSTIRRSLRKFRRSSTSGSQPSTTPPAPAKPLYHEIVVQGYGNGTQAVTVQPEDEGLTMKGALAGRSDSTASSQSNSSSSTTASSVPESESVSSTVDTLSTSLLSSPTTPTTDAVLELEMMLSRWGPQDKAPVRSCLLRSTSSSAISGELQSLASGLRSCSGAPGRKEDVKRKRRSLEPARSAPAPAALQRRYTILGDLRRKNFGFEAKNISIRIRENSISEEAWTPGHRDSDDWSMMLAFMDGTETEAEADTNDVWAQYSDLGGLTDMS